MNRFLFLTVFLLLSFLGIPHEAAAAKTTAIPLEVSGWIPYWRANTGTIDTVSHIQYFNSVMPFGYIVQNDGSLYDAFGFTATSSTSTVSILITGARAAQVKIVPTVMWSNGAAIHAVLSNATRRRALETRIATLATEQGFDGIDIDFENKLAETRPYFSLFLKGLYALMGKKWVYCSIEPRTPPSSFFAVLPKKLEYANDYVAINNYCDRVEIMAYDQGTVDLKLSAVASPTPYIPISDPVWVKKVITLAAQTISKKKIILGVATYGYEYDLIPLTEKGYRYDIDWALNPGYATTLMAELSLTPTRNSAGELSFLYMPTTTPATGSITNPLHILWWSDAQAISDKINLAKELGVRGVAIFKLDGGEDPALWNVLSAR